jgi:hypothetical protein
MRIGKKLSALLTPSNISGWQIACEPATRFFSQQKTSVIGALL